MTNTTEETEIEICTDCAMICANDDDSGCEDPESTRRELMERWFGYRIVVTCGDDCTQEFSWSECEGCGADPGNRHTAVAVLS
jgi:hypothetical protein